MTFAVSCVQWDKWVDTNEPSRLIKHEIEPLSDIVKASPTCKDPIAIECRTATPDHRPAKSTGQHVRCNLWEGLLCNSTLIKEPICYNYESRLGCLKPTTECGMCGYCLYNLYLPI